MSLPVQKEPQAEIPARLANPPRQDARDLLALLYREIGISAVAAALQINVESERRAAASVKIHPVPGVLRGNDIAA